MRYTKKELLNMLEDEEDDCVIVFEHECKELTISTMEICTDGIVYINLKSR